jgi:hypothetical protein
VSTSGDGRPQGGFPRRYIVSLPIDFRPIFDNKITCACCEKQKNSKMNIFDTLRVLIPPAPLEAGRSVSTGLCPSGVFFPSGRIGVARKVRGGLSSGAAFLWDVFLLFQRRRRV